MKNYISFVEQTIDHNFKGIVRGGTNDLIAWNNYMSNRGITSIKMMKQFTQFTANSILFPRNHFLVEEYNEIIRRLRDSGIADYLWNFFIRKNEKVDAYGPEILTLDQLGVGFIACLFPLGLSIVAFFGELLTDFIARKVFVASMREFASLKQCLNNN